MNNNIHAYLKSVPGLVAQLTRSEEHTSELQSRLHLVCRLLLEKKKMNSVRPGMKPFGSVGDQVRPPSKLTLYAQPSFKLKSLAPVRMLFALRGLTAIALSSWAAVSRRTSVR